MEKYRRGVGLLEVLLVLVVVGVLAVLAAKRYKSYQFEGNIAILKKTASTLITSVDKYYLKTCKNESTNSPVDWHTKANFIAAGTNQGMQALGLQAQDVLNPFGEASYAFGAYDEVRTSQTGSAYYLRQLYVRIPLDPKYTTQGQGGQNNATYFQNLLNATKLYTSGGQTSLEWDFLPYSPSSISLDPSDPNWLLQLGARKYVQRLDPTNPCWFPPVVPAS